MSTFRILLSMFLTAIAGMTSMAGGQPSAQDRTAAEKNQASEWKAETIVTQEEIAAKGLDSFFCIGEISDEVFARMWLKSWKRDCPLKRGDLRYLKMIHCNAYGQPQRGEMVVNKAIAQKVLRIFRKLYEAGYRIERMVLIDNYDADDNAAMSANNTSAFNFRFMAGSKTRISKHGRGLAIDINTLYNPYVKKRGNGTWHIEPACAKEYAFNRERRSDIPYKIDTGDLAYKLFIAEGFKWGGNWKSLKDYQHFEIDI